jgi:hypothetical protein
MGEISSRFAELMARIAKSDSELFRTISEQNASIRQMVDNLAITQTNQPSLVEGEQLATTGLLPSELCEAKELKARFGKLVEAKIWIESQIGTAPGRLTWAIIEQTCRQGAWPVLSKAKTAAKKSLTADELDRRLTIFEQKLEKRLAGLEAMLQLIAEAIERN